MSEPAIFFPEVNERQGAFHRRAFLMGGVTGLGLLGLGGRLMHLQLIEAGRYRSLSEGNQFNYRLVPPPRGRILDRNGIELASNRPDFRILVSRDQVQDIGQTLDVLSTLLPITPERREQLEKEFAQTSRFVPVVVADDLTWDEFARINARLPELPGVTPDMSEVRVYHYGGAFAHVIGYVSKVSGDDLKKAGPTEDQLLLHNPGFRIGKQGVEKSLDLKLRGAAGAQKVEVDARGRVVGKDRRGDIAPVPGAEVVLSLDADVQNRAIEVFGEESGAAVVMDVRNGDVLCLMSAPSFDANRFVKGMPRKDYAALAAYERKPLFNKALTATYPPGSTFKMMVALCGLENNVDPNQTHVCGGAWAWGGRVWHCDARHGVVNMHDAISTSCDIYFYQLALQLGPDRIAAMARRFGLGDVFPLGIPGQRAGLVPDTAYKRRAFKKDPVWHPGETPSMGIGQGYLNLNPMQLCVMASRLANGHKAIEPRLIRSIGGVMQPAGDAAPDIGVMPEHIAYVREAMSAVTTSGTAARTGQLGLGPVKMAGKTGTAQSHTYTSGNRATLHLDWQWRDHAWFVGYAPDDDPRYAISVLVEHGGWGASAAAPRAREIMRTVLLKDPAVRARIVSPMPMPEIPEGELAQGAAPPPPTIDPGGVPPPSGAPPR